MDLFGSTDPRMMPAHLFGGAVHLDYKTAIRGDPQKQNYSVCPRHWYLDADFNCARCRREFTWTAGEQKAWFEKYRFWIDSHPRLCKKCMADRKQLEALKLEYDSTVAAARPKGAMEQKQRVIEVVRELEAAFGRLPENMTATKALFERQLQKACGGT